MPYFPPTGGGINAPNGATLYVDPNGSDGATGLIGNPVQTVYVGLQKILAAGGGFLYVASGCDYGGPIGGQGAWLANDQQIQYGVRPGFIRDVPCRVIGQGPGQQGAYAQPGFQQSGCAIVYAGSNRPEDYRTKPALWMVSTSSQITFENIQFVPARGYEGAFSQGVNCAFRMGWDYPRNEDGSIAYQAVTGATRTGTAPNGVTVYNVALTPALNITHATRVSNVTTLTVDHSALTVDAPPYNIGSKIYFTSSDPGTFPSGSYEIIAVGMNVDTNASWDVSFSDPGSNASAANTGTIRSTGVYPRQLIDVQSTDSNIVSTQYLVTACAVLTSSTGTVTVADPYGNAYSTASPVGQLACQIRDLYSCVPGPAPNLLNCSSRMSQDASTSYVVGPMIDLGGIIAFPWNVQNCYVQGYKPTIASGLSYDYRRSSAIVAYGGPIAPTGLTINNPTGHQATLVFEPVGTTTTFLHATDALWDVDGSGEAPAAYIINGTPASPVYVNNFKCAESSPGFGNSLNVISGVPGQLITGDCTGYVASTGLSALGPSSNAIQVASGESPWEKETIGSWGANGAITGRHPAAFRPNISPANRRFAEVANPVGSYGPAPTATGKLDPNGLNNAFEYDDSVDVTYGSSIIIYSFGSAFTFQPGDYLVVKGWINSIGQGLAGVGGSLVGVHGFGTMTWATGGDSWLGEAPNTCNGWQYVAYKNKITSASGTQNLQVSVLRPPNGLGGKLQMLEWNIEYIPAAQAAAHDAAEHGGASRAVPLYLPVGAAGTWPGQVFYGHGGFGAAPLTKTVTTNTGKVVPFYNPDGTLMGYINIVNAT